MVNSLDKLVKVWKIGKLDYCQGLKLQKHLSTLHNDVENRIKNTLLCLEHSPVYTVGIRSNQYTVHEENELRKKGAEFHRTNRGGLITFHGPGQLVVYPILNLKHFKPSMRWYVCQIEKTVINLCKKFYLHAETSPHTGVWIGDNKICAIGIHGSRFITTHGLALNCNTDLKWFDHIVPCGIEGKGVTSLSRELQRNVTVDEVIPEFIKSFRSVFDCDTTDISEQEAQSILSQLKSGPEVVQNLG
ncbi:putative lipoyltransferase 2, mitochondrial [Sitophilus oryzae]|uniref:Octanoyl-[acyl-carrier-protein]:protein N-octanoyltransferase LIPT2, mitochondrial n=1 Tax=Sitophilus oryzae TaxID=7048 RepID=A0A6J2XXZ1_SITOR|nr:putative lipoyltransferase 2, mitochondrial [Sitophilus oryzae]